MVDIQVLTDELKKKAHQLGFPLVGVTTPDPPAHLDFFRDWCAAGYYGTMDWMASPRSLERRSNPRNILPECESILMLGSPYSAPLEENPGGKIAAYALNQDYHDVLGEKLQSLVDFLEGLTGQDIPNRWYTDTGPVLERELAQRAGLGWIGKNTLLINRGFGSYFLLAEIYLGVELVIDTPVTDGYCGNCTRCLEACPTGSLTAPYTLDAKKCISYLTIEYREMIPLDLRPLIRDLIFGCDICQQVCPWNKSIKENPNIIEEFKSREDLIDFSLLGELGLSQEEFSARFKGSPVKRTKRAGYLRNVALALGNKKDEAALPSLANALQDTEPLIRGLAAWALGEINGEETKQILETAGVNENDPLVMKEIQRSLDKIV
jgi:epoxyqueuosine reductase